MEETKKEALIKSNVQIARRGVPMAKRKAQLILCVLTSILSKPVVRRSRQGAH